MKKISFLARLGNEGKLQAVEPSDEIKTAYLKRSDESLSSAKALIRIGNFKDAVALAYYAMYHRLLAALFQIGIKCENHTGSIILLKEVFRIDNSSISKAKAERIDKQYYVDFSVSQEEAKTAVVIAEEFIAEMHNHIALLSEERKHELHEKAIGLFQKSSRE